MKIAKSLIWLLCVKLYEPITVGYSRSPTN